MHRFKQQILSLEKFNISMKRTILYVLIAIALGGTIASCTSAKKSTCAGLKTYFY